MTKTERKLFLEYCREIDEYSKDEKIPLLLRTPTLIGFYRWLAEKEECDQA